jgi:hypothetical protein
VAERIFPAQPLAFAGGRVIASPFQFVSTGEEFLRIVSANSLSGVRVAIQGRRLSDKGEIEPISRDHTPNTDRSIATQYYPLGIGSILNLVVFAAAGAPVIGQTYVMIQITRGQGAVAVLLGTLLAGYVTASQALGWPGSPLESSIAGGGYHRSIQGTLPGAGNNIIESVPTGARWQPLSIYAVHQTDANVANRFMSMQAGSGIDIYARVDTSTAQTASTNGIYDFSVGTQQIALAGQNTWTLPLMQDFILRAGEYFALVALNKQAGDAYQIINYKVREWLEVA